MKNLTFFGVFFCISVFAENNDLKLLPTDNPKTYALKEALELAVGNNFELKKAEQQLRIVQSKGAGIVSEILPKALVRGNTAHNLSGSQKKFIDNAYLGLAVEVPLFDGKKLVALKAGKDMVSAEELSYSHQRDALLFDISKLYAQALLAKSVRDVAMKEVAMYNKQLSVFKSKADLGLLRKLDVDGAEYLLNNAESELATKELDLQNKLANLGHALNQQDYFYVSPFKIESEYFAMDTQSLAQMANESTQIKSLQKKVSSADYFLASERFNFLPKASVSLDSGWTFPFEQNLAPAPRGFSTKVMFNLEIPLFLGGSRLASLKNAHAIKTTHEIELHSATQKNLLKIEGLTAAIKTHQKALMSAEAAQLSAQNASDSAERLFSQGEATGLEVVKANVNLVAASNSVVAATYQLELSKLNLLFLIGKIAGI